MRFEWDENKNQKNIKKHQVSFDEAKTVFHDNNVLYEYDDDHSITEEKFRAYLEAFIADYGWSKEFVNSEVDSVFK